MLLSWITRYWFGLVTLLLLALMSYQVYQLIPFLALQDTNGVKVILLVILLMPLNWLMEVLKLFFYSQSVYQIKQCIQIICQGQLASLFFPAGWGQWIGRVSSASDEDKISLAKINLLSSLMQNSMNMGLGFLIAYSFVEHYLVSSELKQYYIPALVYFIFFIVGSFLLILSLSNKRVIDRIKSVFPKINFHKSQLNLRDYGLTFFLSFLRYTIYMVQFSLLVDLFTDKPLVVSIQAVACIFCIQSFIILPSVVVGAIRGGIAAYIFSYLNIPFTISISISWLLYLINVFIPAFIAVLFYLKYRTWIVKS